MLAQSVNPGWARDVPAWTTANGYDTMFTLWNPSNAAEDLMATFYFANGSGQYQLPIHLDAQASMNLDMAQLVALNEPDAKGHTFPAGTSGGSVEFSSPKGMTATITLSVGAAEFNVENATCSSCCICCGGISQILVCPNPGYCPIQIAEQMYAEVYFSNGGSADITNEANWSTGNGTIATVGNTRDANKGVVTGHAVGSTTLSAQFTSTMAALYCLCNGYCYIHSSGTGSGQAEVWSVSLSPSSTNMSTGDNPSVNASVSGPANTGFSVSFGGTSSPTSNPDSSGAVSLTISSVNGSTNSSGSASVNSNVTASPEYKSGVFSVTGSVFSSVKSSAITINVPPQVLIQMMYGEAGCCGSEAQLGVSVAARNRIGDTTYFSGDTNYQNTITTSQFNGLSNGMSINNGISPELTNAVSVWLDQTSDFITPSGGYHSQCFWSPTSTQWSEISTAVQSGTTDEAQVPNVTGCYSGAPNGQQIRVVSAVGAYSSGVPYFVFQGPRPSASSPVAIQF